MRKMRLLSTLLVACAFAGCKTTTVEETLESKIDWQADEMYAIISLDWSIPEDTEIFYENYDEYMLENYGNFVNEYIEMLGFESFGDDTKMFLYDGTESYLVIPRYKQLETKIYEYKFDEDLVKGQLLDTVKDEDYFILKCNIGDLFPEILLENGECSFSPSISLRDGSINSSDRIKDLTNYPKWLIEEMSKYE